jgi:hypothetical protein
MPPRPCCRRGVRMSDETLLKIREILRPGWKDEDSGNHYDMLRDIEEVVLAATKPTPSQERDG